MESDGQENTISDPAEVVPLLGDESEVDNDPKDESRSHLVERFDVERADAGVEAASDEPLHVGEVREEWVDETREPTL